MKHLLSKVSLVAVASLFSPCFVEAQGITNDYDGVLELSLRDAAEIALAENPTIVVADKQVELKKISQKEAWQNLLPQLSLSGNVNYTIQAAELALGGQKFKMGSDNVSAWTGAAQLSLPIFAPTVYATMKLSDIDLKNAVEQSRESRLDLLNQVEKAYFQLILAQDSYKALQQSLEQAENNFKNISAMYRVGSTSEFDMLTAEVQVRNMKPTVVQAQNAVEIAKLQLKVLMGVTANVDLLVNETLDEYESMMYDAQFSLGSVSLENNSSMRQLRNSEDMLRQSIKVQSSMFAPSLSLAATYQTQSMQNADLNLAQYQWSNSSSLVFSLSIPIYKASNFTKLKSAKLQLNQLGYTKTNTERQLVMQIRTYQNNIKASLERVESAKQAIVQSEKGRQIAETRYNSGTGTIIELNSSELSVIESKLSYSQSIFDCLSSMADLNKVVGNDGAFITTKGKEKVNQNIQSENK